MKCTLETCWTHPVARLGASILGFWRWAGFWQSLIAGFALLSAEALKWAPWHQECPKCFDLSWKAPLLMEGLRLVCYWHHLWVMSGCISLWAWSCKMGPAHRAVWACRQDTGLKPCLCCKNLFQLRDAGSLETADSKIFAKFLKRSQIASGYRWWHPQQLAKIASKVWSSVSSWISFAPASCRINLFQACFVVQWKIVGQSCLETNFCLLLRLHAWSLQPWCSQWHHFLGFGQHPQCWLQCVGQDPRLDSCLGFSQSLQQFECGEAFWCEECDQ